MVYFADFAADVFLVNQEGIISKANYTGLFKSETAECVEKKCREPQRAKDGIPR